MSAGDPVRGDPRSGEGLRVDLLGPVEVRVADHPVVLGPKARAVVAVLTLAAGRPVSVADLVTAVWGEVDEPERAAHALQQQVSTIRKAVAAAGAEVRAVDGGYRLADRDGAAVPGDLDAMRRDARRADELAPGSPGAVDAYASALAHWRGAALADLRTLTDRLEALARSLDHERSALREAWAAAALAAGGGTEVVAALQRAVADDPWNERLCGHLMVALYRSGRAADALAAYQETRRRLGDDLGVEPGPELRAIEQAVLVHDASLREPAPALAPAAPPAGDELFRTVRPGAAPRLAVRLPDGQVVVLAGDELVVGRDPAAALRLVDSRVSRRHAVLRAAAAGWTVHDEGSTNGTSVNGAPADGRSVDGAPPPLAPGDVIDVGGVQLAVVELAG